VVKQTAKAKALLTQSRRDAELEYDKAEQARDAVGTTVWGRVNEQVRKLALLYSVSADHQDPLINADAAKWASEIVQHLTRRMLFMASTHVAENPFESSCLKAINKLREEPEFKLPHSVLLKKMRVEAKVFRELIITLEQRGDILTVCNSTPGRPAREYQLVNPVTK
jgi:hypothetical protein